MAIKKTIEIEAKLDKAVDGIENVNDKLEDLTETQSEINKNAKENTKQLGILGKAAKGIQAGFKGIGLAIKAAGIGLVIKAFDLLVDIFKENQIVVDAFNTSFNFLSLAFNDFFNFISSNVGTVIGYFKDLFENPEKKIRSFGDSLQKYFVNAFKQALNAAEAFGTAIQALFRGDFGVAADLAKEGLSELADAFVGVEEGGVEVLTEGFDKLTTGITKYTKSTLESARAITELNKSAEIASVINQGLIEKYDRQAEQQRQIRDDETNTISERIAANEKLSEILEEQEMVMLANADAILASAQAEFDRNGNTENYIALLEAQNEKAAISAQIEGFRSEQKSNYNALLREEQDLQNSLSEAESMRNIDAKRFNAEQIDDELLRLEALKMVNQEEIAEETKRLEAKIELYKEGTQARQDAEQELLDFQEQARQESADLDKQYAEAARDREIALQQMKMDLTSQALGAVLANLEEGSKAQKAVAIAQATYDTYAAIQSTFASAAANPTSILFPAQPYIQAGIAAAFGFANIKKIASTSPASAGGGSSASIPSGGGAPQVPTVNFNTLQGGFNQLEGAINNQNQQPIQAYVTTQQINNANQLDRKVVGQSNFG